jgi:hypothetical protein
MTTSPRMSDLKPKPIDIFIVAEQFRFAGKMATIIPAIAADIPKLRPIYDEKFTAPTATMVCAAFSLELYFKCLIRIGRKPYQTGHDLVKLFNFIGKRNRSKIKQFWIANSTQVRADVQEQYLASDEATPTVDFNYCLSVSRNAFNLMRYIYEQGIPPGEGWLGDTIVEGARQAILDKHPEWETARQIGPLPLTSFRSTSPKRPGISAGFP